MPTSIERRPASTGVISQLWKQQTKEPLAMDRTFSRFPTPSTETEEIDATMSWEYRGKQGPYYTRSRSINGRIVREYIGAGLSGRLAAAEDEERRKQREDRRRTIHATIDRIDQLESSSKALEGLCKSAVETELYRRGFHLWHRGWRRRRYG